MTAEPHELQGVHLTETLDTTCPPFMTFCYHLIIPREVTRPERCKYPLLLTKSARCPHKLWSCYNMSIYFHVFIPKMEYNKSLHSILIVCLFVRYDKAGLRWQGMAREVFPLQGLRQTDRYRELCAQRGLYLLHWVLWRDIWDKMYWMWKGRESSILLGWGWGGMGGMRGGVGEHCAHRRFYLLHWVLWRDIWDKMYWMSPTWLCPTHTSMPPPPLII